MAGFEQPPADEAAAQPFHIDGDEPEMAEYRHGRGTAPPEQTREASRQIAAVGSTGFPRAGATEPLGLRRYRRGEITQLRIIRLAVRPQ